MHKADNLFGQPPHYLANKSLNNRWFPEDIFPVNHFHKMDGELLDSNFEQLTNVRLDEIATEPSLPGDL